MLLIDADPQGSLSASLGIGEPDALKVTLSTILMNVVNEENIDPKEGIIITKKVWICFLGISNYPLWN